MANAPAPALLLRDGDRDVPESWTRSTAIRAGLADAARPGRPRHVDDERIIAATLTAPPKRLGVTH